MTQFMTDWQSGRIQDAAGFTTDPAAAAQVFAATAAGLADASVTIDAEAGDPYRADDGAILADATAQLTWHVADAAPWSYQVRWNWVWRADSVDAETGTWLLKYSPQVVHPDLGSGQKIAVRFSAAIDGPIVDRNDVQLISDIRVYSVVLLVGKLADVPATAKKLAELLEVVDPDVSAQRIIDGVAQARASGDDSYTVTNVREADFTEIETALTGIAGVTLPSTVRPLPPTTNFADALLPTALPIAHEMTAGRPGWRIVIIDAVGDELTTLADDPVQPGPKVTLTLDPAVQIAAQESVDSLGNAAVIVAIEPSTGEILAVAQNAQATTEGQLALRGQYPPGSIFKIVTATAAVDAGLITPDTKVACPGEWRAGKYTIRNQGFALGTVTAREAFAHSCNTTFADLASEMTPESLPDTAAQYGIGLDFDIPGMVTFTGAIQAGESGLARAQNGFGQGTDLVTPFSAALMAATAATGSMPMPLLIRGTTTTVDRPAPPRSDAAADAIRQMMRAVVTDGTAKVLQKDGEVYAKTGTAEYVNAEGGISAHGWTVGFRDDIAFSALIVDGSSSKYSNDLVHDFLSRLDAAG